MQVEFGEGDMDKLANIVAAKLETRVMNALMNAACWEALSSNAHKLASAYMSKATFESESTDFFRDALQADGKKLLHDIVTNAVRQVSRDDPELSKLVRQSVYNQAIHASKMALQRMQDGMNLEEDNE